MIKLKDILLEGKLTEKYGAQNDGPRLAVGQKIKYRKFNGKVTKVFVKAGQIYYHISYDAGLGLKSAAHFIDPEAPDIQGNKDHPKSPVKRSYIEGKLNEAKETIFDVAARVMKDKQNQNYKAKGGMVKVDMQSANLLTKVFKKVNPKMKKILSDLGYNNPAGLIKTLWAVVK